MNRHRASTIILISLGLLVGCLVGRFVYLHTGFLYSWQLNEHQARLWDIVLKAVAGYLTLTGTFIAVFKYADERAERSEAAQRESKKVFLEKRQAVYFSLGQALAKIMNHDPGDNDWIPAKEQFYSLYWGQISLVADSKVTQSVETFSNALYAVEDKAAKDALADLCVAIMLSCRQSLEETWTIEQGGIDKGPFSFVFSRYWQQKGKLTPSEHE